MGCGIAAIIIYATKKQKGVDDGMLTVGLILGIIGIAFTIIAVVALFVTGAYASVFAGNVNFWDWLNHLDNSGSPDFSSDFFNSVG